MKSLQFHRLVSSVVRHVKGSEGSLRQWINCHASNAGTGCDPLSFLSFLGRLADSQRHSQDSKAVVVGGVTTTQGDANTVHRAKGLTLNLFHDTQNRTDKSPYHKEEFMKNVSEEMKHLHELAKRTTKQIRKPLWKLLTSPEWLAQAWEQIRRNQGSQTAGVDSTTATDVDMNLIHKLAEELKTGRYRPQPVRRVYIPKANGKTRPLGIPTITDRIVQQVIKMLLEPIFEADFLDCSHGFRQGRSTHTALRDVAYYYPNISYIIEGDIEGCFDNISHPALMNQIEKRMADRKVLKLIKLFLKAGYLEDWKYHRTYSGTPQGGIISPLLANLFLHQLDEYAVKELGANRKQSRKEERARRNPEYMKITKKIYKLRKKLELTDKEGHRLITEELEELERQMKHTPCYAKDKRHPCKVKYVRYADDFVLLVVGTKAEAEAIRNRVKVKLLEIGLTLSEEKTRITHWSEPIRFLGYDVQGTLRARGVGIYARLGIPTEERERVKDAIQKVCGYYHAPEVDLIAQVNAIYKGWCNYYRYANNPQRPFSNLASYCWWQYAHYLARKQKATIATMLRRERKAQRLGAVTVGNRTRSLTFQTKIGERTLILNLFSPKSGQIRKVSNKQEWTADLKPVIPLSWQSGRSLTTRLTAIERAKGVCERCKEKPATDVHHTIPIKSRSFLARVMSDRSQKQTAIALCEECHLEVHNGSFDPRRQELRKNAGCAERCLSGVGSAVEKPTAEMR
jgi:group II intron reverse transcriptase/maturase